ncbi:MAG: hypothetical protein U1E32_01635 [Rhodoglobus sp.]|nr:hypothetical protein [Rhodoglobus sp.]
MRVDADGIEVRGASAAGVFRGATVLRQLRDPDAESALIPAGVGGGARIRLARGHARCGAALPAGRRGASGDRPPRRAPPQRPASAPHR